MTYPYQTPATSLAGSVPQAIPLPALTAAALSNQGRRTSNEDTVLRHVNHTLQGDPLGLFIVCDGMGGYAAGDVASKMAVRAVGMELAPVLAAASDLHSDRLNQLIHKAITLANHKIRHYAQNQDEKGFRMGTTITLALLVAERLHIASVGDSRAYLWRHGQLQQITRDHSLVADLAEHVTMSQEAQAKHPYRSILTRALGRKDILEVDQYVLALQQGDRLLLCTDGLWKAFDQHKLLNQQMGRAVTAQEQCRELVAAAGQHDNSDNISAIVIHYDYPTPLPGPNPNNPFLNPHAPKVTD